jgi:hypothetical protein
MLAKTKNNATLGFLDDVETGCRPEQQDYRDNNADTDAAAFTRSAVATATLAAKQAAEFLLEILENLVEVRWALITAIAPGVFIAVTARFVPGHALLQIQWLCECSDIMLNIRFLKETAF